VRRRVSGRREEEALIKGEARGGGSSLGSRIRVPSAFMKEFVEQPS